MENNRTRYALVGLVVLIALLAAVAFWYTRNQPTPAAPTPTAAPAPTATNTPEPAPTDTPAPVEEATPTAAPAEEATPAAEEEAYPAPAADATDATDAPAEEGAYPPPQVESATEEGAYPAPAAPTEETSRIPIVPFAIERPVAVGSTVIRGTGPAGVPILVISVTFMGEVLGEGVIGEDGAFEVTVPPLEDQLWVGVAPADLAGTEFTYEDLSATGFYGEGAAQVPQVGFVYDSVTVGA